MRIQGVRFKILAITAILNLAAIGARADTSTAPVDSSNYSRTVRYIYEAGTGRLSATQVEPDNLALCKTTSITYDAWGNVTSSSESNCEGAPARVRIQTRTTRDRFDAVVAQPFVVNGAAVSIPVVAGVFATTNENALSQARKSGFDPRFGLPIRVEDPNGAIARDDLDDFGRVIRKFSADGTSVVTQYCVLSAAGVDMSSNSPNCPSVASPERPDAAVSMTHTEPRNTQDSKSGPFIRTYLDALGRSIRSVTESFDGAGQPAGRAGTPVVSDTVYGPEGQKLMQTGAYFLASGSSALQGSQDVGVTSFDYDDLGRVVRTYSANPNGRATRAFGGGAFGYGSYGSRASTLTVVQYSGAVTTTTDPQGHTASSERDALAQIIRVTDRGGAQLAYRYDAFGLPIQSRDALQNVSTTTFDVLGRVVASDDPDKGVSQTCLDVLGQVKSSQNSKQRGSHGQSSCPNDGDSGSSATGRPGWTTYAYDVLGRRTEQRASNDVYQWSYDSGTGAIGRLSQSTTAQGVTKRYYYDALGRATSSRTDITQGPSFATSVAYDGVSGHLASKTYPTGLKVGYEYTARGFLSALRTLSSLDLKPLPATSGGAIPAGSFLAANTVLWSARTQRADGRLEQAVFSSGVVSTTVTDAIGRVTGQTVSTGALGAIASMGYAWDDVDNLTSRVDNIGSGSGAVSESFEYDKLNRLAAYAVSSPTIPNIQRRVELKYNALGMMLSKDDVGSYAYPAQGVGVRRPHAPLSVAGAALQYDLNGNVIAKAAGKYSTLTYTEFDRVATASSSFGIAYAWSYDESQFRVKETRVASNGTRTLWYLHPDAVGGLGYELETLNGVNSHRHFLTVGSQTVGVVVSAGGLPAMNAQQVAPADAGVLAINKIEYWHQNHQNSLVATTDHSGAVTARYAYDPFGKRRQNDGNYDLSGSLVVDWRSDTNAGTARGFTGHEQLNDIGLINMNGRIYDDLVGVFLQGDPVLQDRFNTQNYSAYSYVYNNPLNASDPSGMVAQLPPVDIDGKRTPKKRSDDSWPTKLSPTSREMGDNEYAVDMALSRVFVASWQSCPSGACLRLIDTATVNPPTATAGTQFSAASYLAKAARKISSFASQASRSFGVFDRFKPSRESINEGVRTRFFAPICVKGCFIREVAIEATQDSAAAAIDGFAEAANRYYPSLAEIATLALGVPEAAAGATVADRVAAIHGVLDPIAANRRTTAVLETTGGTRIVASGGRDLSRAQRSALQPGEVGARSPGEHAERTAIRYLFDNSLTPSQLAVSRPICFSCREAIEASGGRLTSSTSATWPR